MATTTELLDLQVPQRIDSFRFDLVDVDLSVLGEVRPQRDTAPRIENNINRAIKRTLSGLRIDAIEQLGIDTVSARLRPTLLLQNGEELPLGVFLFGDASRRRHSWGLDLDGTLVDLCYVLEQGVGRVVGYPVGTNPVTAALALAAEVLPANPTNATATTFTTGAPIAWPPDVTRLTIMNDLMALCGYHSPYFDNAGVLTLAPVPLLDPDPDLSYDVGTRIFSESMIEADDLLEAPNRYVVIDTSASDAPIVGSYDIPDAAPNSIANRGFPVVKTIQLQGVGTPTNASIAAQAAYASDSSTYKWVTFAGPIDPRHDTFDVVGYLGETYREQRWQADLVAGAPMIHELRKVYQ